MDINQHRAAICSCQGVLLLICTLNSGTVAFGDVIYQQDFENFNNADGLWSTSTLASLGGPYTSVLGRFDAGTATLNLHATETNTGGLGGNGGGGGNSNPFNITVDHVNHNRSRIPLPDQGGGGGSGGPINPPDLNIPNLNLGDAVSGSNTNSGPPEFGPGTYAVHFDLMLFDSWDGDYAPYGPDSFAVMLNGQTLFDEVLYAYSPELNFRLPDETPDQNVYNTRWIDNIYRDIEVLVDLSTATDLLSIDFIGRTTQGINDESWGIDNILVEKLSSANPANAPVVPAPGAFVLLGAGFGLMGRRKR